MICFLFSSRGGRTGRRYVVDSQWARRTSTSQTDRVASPVYKRASKAAWICRFASWTRPSRTRRAPTRTPSVRWRRNSRRRRRKTRIMRRRVLRPSGQRHCLLDSRCCSRSRSPWRRRTFLHGKLGYRRRPGWRWHRRRRWLECKWRFVLGNFVFCSRNALFMFRIWERYKIPLSCSRIPFR